MNLKYNKSIGNQIKIFRNAAKLTQRQLSKITHISLSAIGKYEIGERIPKYDALNKIAEALNTNVYNLLDDNTTLTSKLLKLFEKTICQYSADAKNTLELICEMIDIDEEVINKAMSNNEDISENYLVSIVDIIFKEYPDEFNDFYNKNKEFIYFKYPTVAERYTELELKSQYKKMGAKINENTVIFPSISFEKIKNTEKIKNIVDKRFPLFDAEATFLSNPNLEKIFNYSFNDLAKHRYDCLLIMAIENAIKQTLIDIEKHIKNGDLFDGFDSWISKESPAYETIKKYLGKDNPPD